MKRQQMSKRNSYLNKSGSVRSLNSGVGSEMEGNETINALTQSMLGAGSIIQDSDGIRPTSSSSSPSETKTPFATVSPNPANELTEILRKQSESVRFLLTTPMTNYSQEELLLHFSNLREEHERLLIKLESAKKSLGKSLALLNGSE